MDICNKRKDGSSLTWSEVNNMPYTAKVSKESYHFRNNISPIGSSHSEYLFDPFMFRSSAKLFVEQQSYHGFQEELRRTSRLMVGICNISKLNM